LKDRTLHDKFVLFGYEHLIVIALTFAIPLAMAAVVRGTRDRRVSTAFRSFFIVLLIGTWIAWYVLFIARDWLTLSNALPMNLCDWATIAILVALMRQSQKGYELAYFWSLAGTMQGLVTPDVNFGFPEPQFIVFFLGHSLIIAAVVYLTVGERMRPMAASIPRAIGWSLVYAAAASVVDFALRTNYGFFRAKPGHATLFDFMPAWPWYIPIVVGLGFLSVLFFYAPWAAADALRRRVPQPA
jgi:hypothetical integral membrane protein (TIGR02206 family)